MFDIYQQFRCFFCCKFSYCFNGVDYEAFMLFCLLLYGVVFFDKKL